MTIRVLLVDDEPEVTAALRVVLRPYDLEIATASSGHEGLRVLDSLPIDVVVSDEQMIGMPGSEFLIEVRKRYPDIARIVLTGRATMDETLTAINEAEVFRYLRKPSSAAELAQSIEDAAETVEATRRRMAATRDTEFDTQEFEEAVETIEMWYQPLFDRQGEPAAYEALLRTFHTKLSNPDLLIAAATSDEKKAQIDRTVRTLVASQISTGWPTTRVFINLLPESLEDPVLLGDDDPLHAHADQVTLEITERASLSDMDDVEGALASLRQRGYRVALDDLGAGYAGLTSFSALEPDVVKFDLELVRGIDSRPWSARLVESMVGVCRQEGVMTVAEGIETAEELEALKELGVDLFQGYLLGKPGPPPVGEVVQAA